MLGRFGDYTLMRKLGAGGMAEVFLARVSGRQPAPGSPPVVVVKRILPHLSRNRALVDLFLNEARITARVEAPNVARVYYAGRVDDRDYITMEFVAGADLARLQTRCDASAAATLGCGAVTRLVRDVCTGLQAAHDSVGDDGAPLELVHGDIHLHNVMVTFEGTAKVIDFGVARATSNAPDTAARGTYAYMSPEQLKGEPYDRRSDVFSVGAVAWELLAGRPLFKRTANYLTMRAVVEDDVPPLAPALGPDGEALDPVLSRAVAKQPGDRYDSCAELADALAGVAEARGWDTSAHSIEAPLRTLFAPERAHVDDALAASSTRSVEDWLMQLEDSIDISWLFE